MLLPVIAANQFGERFKRLLIHVLPPRLWSGSYTRSTAATHRSVLRLRSLGNHILCANLKGQFYQGNV